MLAMLRVILWKSRWNMLKSLSLPAALSLVATQVIHLSVPQFQWDTGLSGEARHACSIMQPYFPDEFQKDSIV